MKKIKVTLQREIEVDVFIDETIVDEQTLKAIYDHFDETIYDEPESCEDKPSRYERGLYNYARSAAIVATELGEREYITFKAKHTKAEIKSDYLESKFEKMITIRERNDK